MIQAREQIDKHEKSGVNAGIVKGQADKNDI